jgi:hypothetical protein
LKPLLSFPILGTSAGKGQDDEECFRLCLLTQGMQLPSSRVDLCWLKHCQPQGGVLIFFSRLEPSRSASSRHQQDRFEKRLGNIFFVAQR